MNIKRTLTYWFPKIIGMILLVAQLKRYLTNELIDNQKEAFVTIIAVAFFINVKWILDTIKLKVKNSNNENNNQLNDNE